MKLYENRKDTGVEWLGGIPGHWELARLKFVAPVRKNGKVAIRPTAKIALENIESNTGRLLGEGSFEGVGSQFRKGDILFGKLRPYLAKVLVAPMDGEAVSDLLVLYPDEDRVDKQFLFYQLINKDFISVVDSSTYGAKMPRASWEFIGDLKITHPPLEEQQAIADFLDRKTAQIDRLIELKQRQVELLQEQRVALILEAVTRGLDPNAPMKDSGIEWLGKIPSHWKGVPLKHLGDIVLGQMLTPRSKSGWVEKPYLRAKNIAWETVDTEDVYSMWFSPDELKKYRLRKGDLLISEGGEVGRTAIWNSELEECYIQNSVNKVTINPEHSARFFLYQSQALGKIGYYDSIVNRVSIAHLTKEKLKDVKFLVPPFAEQEAIASYLDSQTAKIDKLTELEQRQMELLREQRTALISEAVTGKIDLSQASLV